MALIRPMLRLPLTPVALTSVGIQKFRPYWPRTNAEVDQAHQPHARSANVGGDGVRRCLVRVSSAMSRFEHALLVARQPLGVADRLSR